MKLYDVAQFADLPDEILRLVDHSGQGSFFSLPGWYRLVADTGLSSGSRASFAVGAEVPIAMACRHVPRERILHSCTSLYTCEFDLLGARTNATAVRAFAKELGASLKSLDGVRIEGLDPAGSHFSALLEGLRAAGLVVKPYFGWANWFESTNGLEFEDYASRRPASLRNTWKRKSATLERSARTTCHVYRDGDPNTLVLLYENIREKSWKAAEPYPAFIPALIRLAAEKGALRFGVLSIDGEPAAAQFWIVWSGRATIYKLVHAEKFAQFSPGTLLTMEMMRTVLGEDRPFEIDFGRGDDAYKKLWLSTRRERWGVDAADPRTLRGLVRSAGIKAAVLRNRIRRKARVNAGGGFLTVKHSRSCETDESGRPMSRPS